MSAFTEPMKKKKLVLFIVAVLVALTLWIAWGNTALELNTCTVVSEELPDAFDGFRIAHVSDLHNAQMGKNNASLLEMLRSAQPDMIAITGDIVDSRRTDMDVAVSFVREAVKIAPCFYVTGNHEARLDAYGELKTRLEAAGVVVLENEKTTLERNGEQLTVMGVDDASFRMDYLFGDASAVTRARLAELTDKSDGFTVLLSHRPELFEVYVEYDMDLTLSGHAHGGQFRLPFAGGLIAPNQGLFPQYDAGLFTEGNTNMIVSRGIGNSLFPFRVNNPPEVILVELRCGN